MSLSRLTASWNYCNPGELLLMRQASAAIQLPSTNSRYLTEEEDSHLEKNQNEKNKWTAQESLLEIPTEFNICYSGSKVIFLLFVLCLEYFSGSSEMLMYIYHCFIILSCFVISPFKVLPAKFFSQTIWILSIWQTVCWLFFFLATHFNRTEISRDALGLLFCSVSRSMQNLRNIKYSLLFSFFFLCRTRKRNGSCTMRLRWEIQV